MRSNLRTIADVPPDDEFDNDPKNALTLGELCPLYRRKKEAMLKYAHEMIGAGRWERKLRRVEGRAPIPVYRLTTGKKKK